MKQEDLKIEQATFEKVLEVAISERTANLIKAKFKDEEYVAKYIYATIGAQLKRHDLRQFLLEPLDKLVAEELETKDLKTPLKKLAKDTLKAMKDEFLTENLITKFLVNGEVKDKLYHYQFQEVLLLARSKEPLFLYGETGTGKTALAFDVADALGLEAYSISANEQTSKVDFLGYYDANSRLIRTPFREAFEHGGVYIIDEIDAANANVLTVLNSALSNTQMSFPDGNIKRHENFLCICTANTIGDGESMNYVGRNQLDAATLDRFIMKKISYPTNIEIELVTKEVLDVAMELRKVYASTGSEEFISTRKILQAQKLVALGMTVEEAYILLLGQETYDKVK
jgi:hypothetical protein